MLQCLVVYVFAILIIIKQTMRRSFKKHLYIYIIGIVVVIAVVIYFVSANRAPAEQTLVIHPTDFVSTVSVSGKVVAVQNADLGFDQSGRISSINAKVGDLVRAGSVLASIDSADIRANVLQKQAALQREQAKLASLQVGSKPEEIAVYQQKYDDAGSAFVIAMKSAYLQVEDAIKNKSDSLFTNGDSVNPTLNITTQSDTEKRSLESERIILRDKLAAWKSVLTSLSATPTVSSINQSKSTTADTIMLVKSFFDHLGSTVSNLNPAGSGIAQSVIDTYKSTVSSGAQEVAAAASAEQSADASWSAARDSLALIKSGSTAQDVNAQVASIRAAEADLENAQAQLAKTRVVAPFDGVVTKMDVKVGEIVSPATSEISMMSNGAFQIESYVPEINIAAIALNDHAKITLDAYGENVTFAATVISIDPAETVRDGVSTYKIKLQFDQDDPRVKSGMTANVIITTAEIPNAVTVPQGIIVNKGGQKFVTVKKNGVNVDVAVTTGGVSSLGQINVTTGLNDGDIVIIK